MHDFRFLQPLPALRRHVRFYAQFDVHQAPEAALFMPVPARAVPIFEFVFQGSIVVHRRDLPAIHAPGGCVMVGAQTRRRVDLALVGRFDSFSIVFQPAGIQQLFGIPMPEITDNDHDLRAVLGGRLQELEHRLADCTTARQRADVADRFLAARLDSRTAGNGIARAANALMACAGNLRIDELARAAGLGLRQFERRYLQQTGLRPKQHARIIRFESALAHKAMRPTESWTAVAQTFGYHDQMHLIHDFQALGGTTPSGALQEVERLFHHHLVELRGDRTMDTDGSRVIML